MNSESVTVYFINQLKIILRSGGNHPWHRLYSKVGVFYVGHVDYILNHFYCLTPGFFCKVLLIMTIPSRAKCACYIYCTAGSEIISKAKLFNTVIHVCFSFLRIQRKRISPDSNLCYTQSVFFGGIFITVDLTNRLITLNRKNNRLTAKTYLLLCPLTCRTMLKG